MLKYYLISKILFAIFIVLLCFSACSKKQNEKEVSLDIDFNTTNVISEKQNEIIDLSNNINAIKVTESSVEKTSEDLSQVAELDDDELDYSREDILRAIEFRVKFNENPQEFKIQSEDDLLTAEILELLSPEDLKKYISILVPLNHNVVKSLLQYVIDSKIIDKLDADSLRSLFYRYEHMPYDSEKVSENLNIFYNAVKNTGDLQLLDDFFGNAKYILKRQYNEYK